MIILSVFSPGHFTARQYWILWIFRVFSHFPLSGREKWCESCVEALDPPPSRGRRGGREGSTFLNIFLSTYRTIIIFFLAQRTRLKTPFTYLEHYHIANRKFFRALWKRIWPQKRRIHQKFPAQFLLYSWDHRIRHFSFNIIRSVHRMVPIFRGKFLLTFFQTTKTSRTKRDLTMHQTFLDSQDIHLQISV